MGEIWLESMVKRRKHLSWCADAVLAMEFAIADGDKRIEVEFPSGAQDWWELLAPLRVWPAFVIC